MYQSDSNEDSFCPTLFGIDLFHKLYSVSTVVSIIHLGTNCQGLYVAAYALANKIPNSFIVQFGVPNTALYASAPNHVFGQ